VHVDHQPGGHDDYANAACGAVCLVLAPAYEAPMPQFGVQVTSGPVQLGTWATTGRPDGRYDSSPQDFWRYVGDISEQ